MIQHTALQRNDVLSTKDRLRVAAREASLSKVVRQNPWASVITVGASSLAITGIIGSFRFGGGKRVAGAGGPGLIGTVGALMGPFSGLAMKALEGYIMKKAVTGTEPAQPGEDT